MYSLHSHSHELDLTNLGPLGVSVATLTGTHCSRHWSCLWYSSCRRSLNLSGQATDWLYGCFGSYAKYHVNIADHTVRMPLSLLYIFWFSVSICFALRKSLQSFMVTSSAWAGGTRTVARTLLLNSWGLCTTSPPLTAHLIFSSADSDTHGTAYKHAIYSYSFLYMSSLPLDFLTLSILL